MLIFFDEIQKVLLEVFENEIYFPFLLKGLLEAHHVVAFKHFKHFDLSLDGFSGKLILVPLLKLLDRNSLLQQVPKQLIYLFIAFHTIPYAPSSITSIISYLFIKKYITPLFNILFNRTLFRTKCKDHSYTVYLFILAYRMTS